MGDVLEDFLPTFDCETIFDTSCRILTLMWHCYRELLTPVMCKSSDVETLKCWMDATSNARIHLGQTLEAMLEASQLIDTDCAQFKNIIISAGICKWLAKSSQLSGFNNGQEEFSLEDIQAMLL